MDDHDRSSAETNPYLDGVLFGFGCGHRVGFDEGFRAGLEAADAHAEAVWRRAAEVNESVARDLLRRGVSPFPRPDTVC